MEQISVQPCQNYGIEQVRRSLFDALDRLKGPDPIIRPGEQVLLKVNNIGPYPPEQCATTHPAIVEAMIDWVFDRGGHPIAGDGPIALPQRKPFDVSGIAEVCSRRGVPLIIAARDSVLVDALCAHIVGIGPARYSITRIMVGQHGGQAQFAEVVKTACTASGFARHSQFVLPSTTMKITGRFRQYLPKAVLKYRPIIQIDRCTRCRACVIHCPAQALSLVHDRVVLKSSRCIECYCCMEACETGALRIEGYLLNSRRIFHAVRRLKSWLMGKFMRNWFSVFGVQDRTIFPEH